VVKRAYGQESAAAVQLLCLFDSRTAGKVVSRDDICAALWPAAPSSTRQGVKLRDEIRFARPSADDAGTRCLRENGPEARLPLQRAGVPVARAPSAGYCHRNGRARDLNLPKSVLWSNNRRAQAWPKVARANEPGRLQTARWLGRHRTRRSRRFRGVCCCAERGGNHTTQPRPALRHQKSCWSADRETDYNAPILGFLPDQSTVSLDFGCKYTQLIARRLRESRFFEVWPQSTR